MRARTQWAVAGVATFAVLTGAVGMSNAEAAEKISAPVKWTVNTVSAVGGDLGPWISKKVEAAKKDTG